MNRDTIFSPCRKYRYTLWRTWGDLFDKPSNDYVAFCCLNPSTADETVDDNTVRRCINFARDWGYRWFVMLNLFAFRSTNPKDMLKCDEPIGAENDKHILDVTKGAKIVVAAWGPPGAHLNRDRIVTSMLRQAGIKLMCLRKTATGFPEHPLYLPGHLKPIAL